MPVLLVQPVWAELAVTTIVVGSVMMTVCVEVQPLASVIVTVYVPAHNPVAVTVVPPLGAQLYPKLPVPPDAVIVPAPLQPALHEGFVIETTEEVSVGGCVMTTVAVDVLLAASVTVTV